MDLVAVAHSLTQLAVAVGADGSATVAAPTGSLAPLGAGLAAGLAVLGVGIGVGKLAASALDGAARQPEMAGRLQATMIIAIAFIEALALIALMVTPFILPK